VSIADGKIRGSGNCPECLGYGEVEDEVYVVDWVHGGYIDGSISVCPVCDGNGEIDDEDNE